MAQQKEKTTFTEHEIETLAKQDLQQITKNFEISDNQKEQLFNFFMYKNKFFNQLTFDTIHRKSIIKRRFTRQVHSILNQNNNGQSIVLGKDLLRHLNLYEVKIPKQ